MTSIAPIHSSLLNKFSFLGRDLSHGLADDTYFELTFNGPLTFVGEDAGSSESYISVNPSNMASLSFTLNTQSPANTYLSNLVRESKRNGGVPQIGNFHIESGNTLFLYQPKGCHIMERPGDVVGKDQVGVTKTWNFHVHSANEIDVNDYNIDIDLKADISGSITAAIELDILKTINLG